MYGLGNKSIFIACSLFIKFNNMTDKQWNDLLKVINGKILNPLPIGFIIDSPWLPGWFGITILDYYSNDDLWFQANKKVIETFPDVWFLPGFWSELGMCSEPSAFGARCSFPRNEFPHAHKCIHNVEDISKLEKPNPETDGLAPLLLNRLLLNQPKIIDMGHKIRFSVTRGPLNIASYLMGTTEFLTNIMMYPDESHKLIETINEYLIEWHALQREMFPSIDGMLVLDDIIGFIGEDDFKVYGLPYFEKLFDVPVSVKFLHNDADCAASVKYYPEMGVNMYNMAFDTSLNQLKKETDNKIVMLGNIPPRDVLAAGTEQNIKESVADMMDDLDDYSRVLLSCGGGMPPNVSTGNIQAFCQCISTYS